MTQSKNKVSIKWNKMAIAWDWSCDFMILNHTVTCKVTLWAPIMRNSSNSWLFMLQDIFVTGEKVFDWCSQVVDLVVLSEEMNYKLYMSISIRKLQQLLYTLPVALQV